MITPRMASQIQIEMDNCREPKRRSQKSLVFPTPKSGAAVSIKIASGSGLA